MNTENLTTDTQQRQ